MNVSIKPNLDKKTKTVYPAHFYLFLVIYLLIPVLSIEGLAAWSIGAIGAYKTIKLYRNNEKGKEKKALKLLMICLTLAVAYNFFVDHITNLIIEKFF